MAAAAVASSDVHAARARSAARSRGAGGSKRSSVPRASSSTAGRPPARPEASSLEAHGRSQSLAPSREFWEANDAWVSASSRWRVAADRRRPARPGAGAPRAAARPGGRRAATSRPRPTRGCASSAGSLYAAIILLGIAVALSQFTGINRLAASLLASGAIAAAVVGFAARQTLANLVAGIMLAITQPIRVGDWVSFEEQYGVVEDVRLNYTFLRTPGDQRVVIPNERLASGILRNDTLGSAERGARRAGVAARRAPTPRAPSTSLQAETGQEVTVAEVVPWGMRLAVGGEPCPPPERAGARGGAAAAVRAAPAGGGAARASADEVARARAFGG